MEMLRPFKRIYGGYIGVILGGMENRMETTI